MERAFAVAKVLVGLRDERTLYSIRHTFASWLAMKGQAIRTIQELLGHKDLRMTLRYADLSPRTFGRQSKTSKRWKDEAAARELPAP